MGGIGKLFKQKTRIFRLILNSRLLFKNHQNFMVLIAIFGAFSRHVFSMRYNSELLGITVVITGNVLLFKDIKIS